MEEDDGFSNSASSKQQNFQSTGNGGQQQQQQLKISLKIGNGGNNAQRASNIGVSPSSQQQPVNNANNNNNNEIAASSLLEDDDFNSGGLGTPTIQADSSNAQNQMSSLGKRGRRGTRKKDLHVILDKLLHVLQGKDAYGFFLEPVDTSIVTDYLTVIKQPMDFSTMKKKLSKHQYNSLAQFQADFELICANAKTYNSPDTIYYKQADKLLDVGTRLIDREYSNVNEENHSGRKYSAASYDDESQTGRGTGSGGEIEINLDSSKSSRKRSAVYRRAPDGGFLFSSLQKTPVLPDGSLDPESDFKPFSVESSNLTLFEELTVPSLGQVITSKERLTRASGSFLPKIGEYDPYASFAPMLDSSKSSVMKGGWDDLSLYLTYGDSKYKAYIDNLIAFVEGTGSTGLCNYVQELVSHLTMGSSSIVNAVRKTLEDPKSSVFSDEPIERLTNSTDYNLAQGKTLKDVALSIKLMNRNKAVSDAEHELGQAYFLPESVKCILNEDETGKLRFPPGVGSNTSNPPDQTLRDTSILLETLQRHQDERFLKSETKPSVIESNIASKVRSNLASLVSVCSPKQLLPLNNSTTAPATNPTSASSAPSAVQNLMNEKYLPRDPNYSGSLPAARPFAFSSNLSNVSSIPITATMVPPNLSRTSNNQESKK